MLKSVNHSCKKYISLKYNYDLVSLLSFQNNFGNINLLLRLYSH